VPLQCKICIRAATPLFVCPICDQRKDKCKKSNQTCWDCHLVAQRRQQGKKTKEEEEENQWQESVKRPARKAVLEEEEEKENEDFFLFFGGFTPPSISEFRGSVTTWNNGTKRLLT